MKKIIYKKTLYLLSPITLRFFTALGLTMCLLPSNAQQGHIISSISEILRLETTSTSNWISFHHGANNRKAYLWATGDDFRINSDDGEIHLLGDKVGVGTTSPLGKMEIAYNSTVGNPHLYLDETGSDFARISMRNGSGGAFWDIAGLSNSTTPQLNLYYSPATGTARNFMRILPSVNNFEIYGDLTPQNAANNFDLGNNSTSEHWDDCVADDFINFSDRRLKENISPLKEVLPSLMALAPVTYRYIQSFNPDNRNRVGLLAQDVQKIFPSVVIDEDVDIDEKTNKREARKSEYLSMNYIELIPIMIKGMQEQQEIIETQKQIIQDLEKRMTALEQRENFKPVNTAATKQ